MRLHDTLRDRKPETGTAFARAACPVAIEDVGDLAGGNTGATIGDRDDGVTLTALERERDRRTARMLERVADEVAERLQQAVAIGVGVDRVPRARWP